MDYEYNQYADDVAGGRITVCRTVKLAVKRHLNDLKRQEDSFPYIFKDDYAQRAIDFFCEQVHTKGALARQKLHPEPWQQFIIVMIYELGKGDDPSNEHNWIKANPNLDVSGAISTDDLRKALMNARQKSTGMAEFLTKRMDVWINNAECWIDDMHWSRCVKRFSEKNLTGLKCFGALDLSKTTDFTAYTLYFLLPDGRKYAKHRFYILSKDMIEVRMRTDTYLIEKWVKGGYIMATPGETVDYGFMFEDIRKDAQVYDIEEIAYDRNLSSLIIAPLADSFNMVEFNQGIAYMSEPSKAWEKAVSERKIIDNNPVMRWMVSCATIRTDPNDNIKVVKPQFTKSSKRIDGVITSIMANNRLDVYYAREEAEKSMDVSRMIY